LLSPLYVPVTLSEPTPREEVVQVAVPGFPDVTDVVPQPVFELHDTDPVTSSEWMPRDARFSNPYSPLMVAVNVTDCPYTDPLGRLEATDVPAVALCTTCPPLSVPVLVA
jgi:hypothetical protein